MLPAQAHGAVPAWVKWMQTAAVWFAPIISGIQPMRLAKMKDRMTAREGFSLLELLVAMTILAIALVPVAYFYTKSLQVVENAAIRTRAIMMAQERIAEVRQMPYSSVRSNITPTPEQVFLLSDAGGGYDIDVTADDWFGYDFETTPNNPPINHPPRI